MRQVWFKLAQWFRRRRFLKCRQYLFAIISPWKKAPKDALCQVFLFCFVGVFLIKKKEKCAMNVLFQTIILTSIKFLSTYKQTLWYKNICQFFNFEIVFASKIINNVMNSRSRKLTKRIVFETKLTPWRNICAKFGWSGLMVRCKSSIDINRSLCI